MSSEKGNNRQPVSSIGNAWIVCNSRSHPGNVYYFNTVTREAVWNLSEYELEKGRLTTHVHESQSGQKPELCPEPNDNPPTQIMKGNQIGNLGNFGQTQQFGHNLSQQQQQPVVDAHQTQNQTGHILSSLSMRDPSVFDFNALRNQINAFNVINPSPVYNPNIWHFPHAQQYIITPSIPLVNQSQPAVHVGYNPLLQNDTPASRSNNFYITPNPHHKPLLSNSTGRFRNQCKRGQENVQHMDLRQRLALKRKLYGSPHQPEVPKLVKENRIENVPVTVETVNKTADVSYHIAEIIDAVFKESEKKKLNSTQQEETDTLSKLDLTPLKSLAPTNVNVEKWYLIVDMKVLIEEFCFLNIMIEADEHCILLVPQNVMTDLKDFIACSNNIPARRIFHALSRLIDSCRATIGQEANQVYDTSITNPILKTCFGLLDDNFHLILLTNDSELLRYKKFIKVHMYTVEEVKSLLEYSPPQYQSTDTSVPSSSQLKSQLPCDSLIKITIPGRQTSTPPDIGKISTHFEPIVRKRSSTTINKEINENYSATKSSQTLTSQDKEPTVLLKCTNDAAIQTETVVATSKSNSLTDNGLPNNSSEKKFDCNETVISDTDNLNVIDATPLSNAAEHSNQNIAVHKCLNNTPMTVELNETGRRRKIKLKRTISDKPTQMSGSDHKVSEKKTFRWCKRYTSLHTSDITPPKDIPFPEKKTCTNIPSVNIVNSVDDDMLTDEHNIEEQFSPSSENVVESLESSVVCVNTIKEQITVDETSTSGIISNTESNVDTELNNYRHSNDMTSQNNHRHDKNMVHIDSECMEESLKTKCEEWVSRFIQTMEEALTVVLHKEPLFENCELRPPWSLHEAAQCIGKYCNNATVKSAANKISTVLFLLSESSGKISWNMTPNQYMEMFNCGVVLLHEIKAITTNQEDIQVAEASLQKLMVDIKNPNYGSIYTETDPQETTEASGILNESFVSRNTHDETRPICDGEASAKHKILQLNHNYGESAENNSMQANVNSDSLDKCSTRSKASTSLGKYMLRSRLRASEPPTPPSPPVKVIRNLDIKASFFSNLNLQKLGPVSLTRNTETTDVSCKPGDSAVEHVPITFSSRNPNDESDKTLVHCVETVNAPNIVRNFTKCAEFEEKLKNKLDIMSYDEHDDLLDYEEEEDYEYDTTEIEFDEHLSDNEHGSLRTDPNVTQLTDISDIDISNFVAGSPKPVDSTPVTKSNDTFKFMISIFLEEVKNSIKDVKVLCDKCYAELQSPQLPQSQRNELRDQVENARSHVAGLCMSLESMLDRDANDSIKNALMKAGVDMLDVDQGLLSKYWNTVATCKKYAEVFLFSIKEIITAFKTIRS